jgi:hypothetical protein
MDFILPKLDNPSGWFSCFCLPLSIVNLLHLVDFRCPQFAFTSAFGRCGNESRLQAVQSSIIKHERLGFACVGTVHV